MGRHVLWLVLLAAGSVARGDIIFMEARDQPLEHLGGRRAMSERVLTEAQLRSQVLQVLQTSRPNGEDAWTWRESVEERLTAFGDRVVPILQGELEKRDGYEGDAIYVAMLRLERDMPAPREALTAWAKKRFGEEEPGCRYMRVMGIRSQFRNHLFYIVEHGAKKLRVVVALAVDGKVQALEEDAGMTRFFRNEAEPQQSREARQRLSDAAALLALSRFANAYRVEATRDLPAGEGEAASEVEYQMNVAKARVAFDEEGRVTAVEAGMAAVAKVVDAPPVVAPRGAAAPPEMPK